MPSNPGRSIIHVLGAGLTCAHLAYWTMWLMKPLPTPAHASAPAASAHDPDPTLLARAFGQAEVVALGALANIQVAGVYSGGRDSAAVFVVGDRPAKAVRLGGEVEPGSVLVDVDPQSVTLDSGGVRRQLRLPNLPIATSARSPGVPRAGVDRSRDTVTASRTGPSPGTRSAGGTSLAAILAPRPEPRPEQSIGR